MREKEEGLKTQVRPGLDDWEVRIKKTSRFEYDSWDVVKVADIDPNGKIPKMNIVHSMDDPKVKEFIRSKEKIVDSDGFETVQSKRKASSPRNNEAKRAATTPDSQISLKVRQVLQRNFSRPINEENDHDLSVDSNLEDTIRDSEFINESVEDSEENESQANKNVEAATQVPQTDQV